MRAIEEKMVMHLESLLQKLFPDTPVVKVSNNYRIGRKGSLSGKRQNRPSIQG